MRLPKTPFTHTRAVSSCSRRFTKHVSIPALPVAEITEVTWFFVLKAALSSPLPHLLFQYTVGPDAQSLK